MALEQNFEVFSGNDAELSIAVSNDQGSGLDLTGAQALVWALAKNAKATALVTKTLASGVSITDALAGLVTVALNADDLEPLAGEYYHELRLTNSLGKKSTLMYGTVTIQVNLIRD